MPINNWDPPDSDTWVNEPRPLDAATIAKMQRIPHNDPSRGTKLDELRPEWPELEAFLTSYEALVHRLTDMVPSPLEVEGEDWADVEADMALQRFRFWWTWGN